MPCNGDERSPEKNKENVRVKQEKTDVKEEVIEKVLGKTFE